MMQSSELLIEELAVKGGKIGVITLNRPQALNALTYDMCSQLYQHLQQWQASSVVKAVLIKGAGEKAFCAGGDIRKIYELGKHGDYQTARQFFEVEYRLNLAIKELKKPYIALLDGITMGGGLGVSIHGSHRIGTERLLLAMPETGIGFFPDIGGSYFLSRLPHQLGIYLGLTGAAIKVADAIYTGLVDAKIESARCQEFITVLQERDFSSDAYQTVNQVLTQFSAPKETSELETHQAVIENCFSQSSIEAIIKQLEVNMDPWSHSVLAKLKDKSPTSLKVALMQLRKGQHLNIEECLQMEYAIACHFLLAPDFYEGVRAAIVDKDKSPQWQPASLSQVTPAQVEEYFKPVVE